MAKGWLPRFAEREHESVDGHYWLGNSIDEESMTSNKWLWWWHVFGVCVYVYV
jgi:hypothetical protein